MKIFRLKIIVITTLVLVAFRGNALDIKDLDKVRENHFVNNVPLDTFFIKKCMKSENRLLARYAKGLLGTYYIEKFNVNGERIWMDLGFSEDKWFQDGSTINEEMLLFDDMFRICVVYKKYYFFNKILNLFYDYKLNIAQQPYNLFIELKTGNIYNYLEYQLKYKELFISNSDKELNGISKKVKERILFNISAINFSNFDSTNMLVFIKQLDKLSVDKIDSTSSLENILFKLTLLNYTQDSIRADSIALINNTRIVYDTYISPFIISIELENIPLIENVKDVLIGSIPIKYNFVIDNYLRIDDHLKYLLNYRLETVQNSSFISTLISTKYNNSINEENTAYLFETIRKCDSILNKGRELFEPSWLLQKFDIINNIGNKNNNISTQLELKYKNDPIPKLYNIYTDVDNSIRKYDYFKTVDNANIFHSLNFFISYFILNTDIEIKTDTTLIQRVDSIYNLVNYIKSKDYTFSNGNTFEKNIIQIQIQKYIILIKRYLYLKKEFKLYEIICKLDDSYYNGIKNINFPEELYVSSTKERYLAFKASSTKEELYYFDSVYVSTYIKEVAKKDSIIPAFKFIYFQPFTRDIIFDIYSRKNITDSICANLIVINDILINIFREGVTNLNIYENYFENECLINNYKNSYFCIDNKNLNTSKYSNLYKNINMEIFNLFNDSDSIKNKIDSTRRNLVYVISNDLSQQDASSVSLYDIENTKNYTLYGMYSFDKIRQVVKICSIDSLRRIFNFDQNSNNRYYNSTSFFVSDLENKATLLYDLILKPFENNLDTNKSYNLIFPSSLNSIPLDYIYAKKNGSLINFMEFSSMYRAAMKLNSPTLNIVDTAAIFANLLYNDTYCNLTKSTNVGTRAGIVPLAYSIKEAGAISNNIPTLKFERLNASKEQFVNTALSGKYSIMHLITHGSYIPYITNINKDSYFPINPDERQLLLFSSDSTSDTITNNIMTAYETKYFENLSKIKLIFLSACETGSSEVNEYSNSGYQGFVNSFLERGAKSIIATRWKVSDKYSVDFANIYYEKLANLKDFQRAFFETKRYFYQNNTPPYLWTSYVFVQ